LGINRQFLDHDFYTDIITFPLSDGGVIDAEVYISVDRVKENAAGFGVTQREEMLRVIFHGALHLCGYVDKRKSEITLMREKESEYLRLFEKANPR
jgi:rRNA maturation RNase YbeY